MRRCTRERPEYRAPARREATRTRGRPPARDRGSPRPRALARRALPTRLRDARRASVRTRTTGRVTAAACESRRARARARRLRASRDQLVAKLVDQRGGLGRADSLERRRKLVGRLGERLANARFRI